ncbi:TusE/DsrC/DsvC family sulfur relay protein [Marinobacterium sediminicola]|uniref:Sulfurtransferase n=1 Tax=Marinobacterium sediminicola TaxID=518898 RepID=A0ABY1RXL3_9GAMM|nr:TusE/DsrC/DsvC family sulfur relay protein [Marinobacterium sediminicola]ULG70764.1 TusE/DsrC/DsvC family sulfur relay protein [Marinobacterium sediminicola]SMR71661.1 tRNA 2-thiouridine synthesizing protein E [Marinobacterium sediminicola]
MQLLVNEHQIALDDEGYLYDLEQWSPEVALLLAKEEQLDLTEAHWEVIYLLRDFYQQYQLSPAMRPLVKAVAAKLGKEKGRSIYLMKLFPGSPAKVAARLAGLPKPDNCL